MAIREDHTLERWKCRVHRLQGYPSPSPLSRQLPTQPLHSHPHNTPSSWALLGFPSEPTTMSCLTSPGAVPWASQRGGDLGCSLQLGSPCLSWGAPLPCCSSPREDSLPSPEPGHCVWPQRPGQRWASPPGAGGAMMKGTVPVLEGILGWAVAQGREGQHISHHLTRVISTAIEVSAHKVLKEEASP